ncbi:MULTISPECIES: penicillin-binding protein activator [unclassified Myxococcus]|jgi:ABC-type branched-subunit amino acid transport system substrate-binding protein|uniref:penicillin-binding protein activator n=1 Tax=Myxococcus TaxID=32 RepID=UPI001CBAB3CA|nr:MULTISPECIES: penicillin-binding protein activator [unclassified Myxococcus]MBZ4395777.1 penicillin-binding protein activator [Myxococcus sp. AS-1-15]MBZ4411394.1 penicillin-binding protein activator [Myxococcus sp. XM-1-1-1]BDT31138.1 penicillin-binding protein activator [Myxococcus sp. MH1]
MEVLPTLRRSLIVALALLLTACPRSSRIPSGGTTGEDVPTGDPFPKKPAIEVRKDASADAALAQARQTAQATPDKKRAAEAYLSVRKAYPATTAGQDALYQAGVLFFESKDYVNARKSFNELLFENPLYTQAEDAKRKLALSAMEVGAYRDAYQTLSSLAERAEGAEKEQLLRDAARAAEGAGLYGQSLTMAVEEAGQAKTQAERDAAVARVEALVEGRADFVDIARVADGLSPSNPAWPVLTFKLARVYYHLREWNRLEETLNRFLAEAPGSPFAPQARELLARATRRVEAKPRTVGVLLPMTGRYQPIGEAVLRGIQLGLEGSDIELVVKDTQGDVNKTGQAMEQLAFDDGAIAVLGPVLAEDSKRAALVAEELQVPLLTMTRQDGVTDLGAYVFRNMLTNAAQANAVADYAINVKGYKKFALLYPNIPYGVELANEFWDQVVDQGGVVRGAERYSHDQTTFTQEAKKLVGRYYLEDRGDYVEGVRDLQGENLDAFRRRKALEKVKSNVEPIIDFEAIFMPDDWRRVSLVAPALAVEDIVTNACDPRDLERIRKTTGKKELKTVTLFGANQWSSPKGRSGLPELIERGGKFVTCSVYVDGFFVDSQRPATRNFVRKYRESYKQETGKDPGLLEAIGYDSGRMLRQLVEKKEGAPRTRAQMRESLANLKDFDGATGRTSFNDKREAVKQLFLLSIDNKGVTEINVDKEREKAASATGGSGS